MSYYLYLIVIYPIEMLVEVTFNLLNKLLGNPGPACIGVSIVISLLMLPMYRRADALQDQEREKEAEMSHWVTHIKHAFSGDERVMVLSEYYRQQNYKPIYQLRSSISLLLQIPFFMAAYRCLSGMEALQGASFFYIKDLGAPDELLVVGGIAINLLPILMTAINAIACYVYNRGRSLKEQLPPYILALAFMILLYDRPAGLVLYWTCNQIFSLFKNIFMKVLRHPREVAMVVLACSGTAFVAYLIALGTWDKFGAQTGRVFCVILLLACWAPGLVMLYHRLRPVKPSRSSRIHTSFGRLLVSTACGTPTFLLCCAFLTVLMGLLIPTAVIADSPTEFVATGSDADPLHFSVICACIAAGVFMLWAQVFHYLMAARVRRITEVIFFLMSCWALVDYLFFGTDLGNMSSRFAFDDGVSYDLFEKAFNAVALLVAALIAQIIWIKLPRLVRPALGAGCIAILLMVAGMAYNAEQIMIQETLAESSGDIQSSDEKILQLSRTGKNVVFIGIDRAINADFPICLDEKPELAEQFAGFTYYPNTMSFGHTTVGCSASLYGGYEYTLAAINSDGKTLKQDQDEALKVMPVSFAEQDWNVTVCDPPYAGYTSRGNLSIFDEWDNIDAYHTIGAYSYDSDDLMSEEEFEDVRVARIFRYSIFKSAPVFLQPVLYDKGRYFGTSVWDNTDVGSAFLNNYTVLTKLSDLTDISDDTTNCYISLYNETTHQPCWLQLPDYTPALHVDNSAYMDAFIEELTSAPGANQNPSVKAQKHYMVNMAAYIQIGKWLDYLREEGVYDNTRIIIASDHGFGLQQFDYMWIDDERNAQSYNPILLFKDFGSTELTTSDEFMTEADVATLALSGAIDNPTNPSTGVAITSEEKESGVQYLNSSYQWHISGYNSADSLQIDLTDGKWYAIVGDDLFDSDNWIYEGDGQLPLSMTK